ncbi:TATA box-binding protein-associated factor RNA polymerase I subunit A isoform 2-T4 [Polymixia lowei]
MDDLETDLRLPNQFGEDESSDEISKKEKPKKTKLPLADPVYSKTLRETGFHRTTRICLQQITKAMLCHQWQEAAEYMSSYSQALEETTVSISQQCTEIMWKIGTEILHHHPNTRMEDYNLFYEQMKLTGIKKYLIIGLEHSLHLLANGQLEDAKRQLSITESWRHGKESEGQSQRIKLIQAYRSLLDYIMWCDEKCRQSNADNTDAIENQEMQNHFRKSSVNLKEIVKAPGIWDPFILSYVDMLEFYEDHEEALKVLEDYAYNSAFPPNPNAHVFLYRYLKRRDAPDRKLARVLKVLRAMVPSHELMLEYCSLLLQSEKEANDQKALGVALEVLDYACWKSSLAAWSCLKTIIDKLKCRSDWRDIVSEEMTARDWWPAFHFTVFHAKTDSVENPELMEVKASLTGVLCPDHAAYYTAVQVISGASTQKKNTKKMSKRGSKLASRKRLNYRQELR